MVELTVSERVQLLSNAPYLDSEHDVLMKFFSSYPSYWDEAEQIGLVVRDLGLFWKNVEYMKQELGFDSHEEVFLNVDGQGVLIYLISTEPYKMNPLDIVKEFFHESNYDDLRTLIDDLFNLWDNIQKIMDQREEAVVAVEAIYVMEISDDDEDDEDDDDTDSGISEIL